jgi:tetratricopeptide (TPR) repeat protein
MSDWLGAGRAHQRAIELNPSHANAHQQYSWYLALLGRHKEAMTEAIRALELDPLSLGAAATVGIRSYDARQYDKAIEQLLQTLEMDPSFVPAHLYLGQAYVQKAMYAHALAAFHKLADTPGQNPLCLAALAQAHAAAGQRVPHRS